MREFEVLESFSHGYYKGRVFSVQDTVKRVAYFYRGAEKSGRIFVQPRTKKLADTKYFREIV